MDSTHFLKKEIVLIEQILFLQMSHFKIHLTPHIVVSTLCWSIRDEWEDIVIQNIVIYLQGHLIVKCFSFTKLSDLITHQFLQWWVQSEVIYLNFHVLLKRHNNQMIDK